MPVLISIKPLFNMIYFFDLTKNYVTGRCIEIEVGTNCPVTV